MALSDDPSAGLPYTGGQRNGFISPRATPTPATHVFEQQVGENMRAAPSSPTGASSDESDDKLQEFKSNFINDIYGTDLHAPTPPTVHDLRGQAPKSVVPGLLPPMPSGGQGSNPRDPSPPVPGVDGVLSSRPPFLHASPTPNPNLGSNLAPTSSPNTEQADVHHQRVPVLEADVVFHRAVIAEKDEEIERLKQALAASQRVIEEKDQKIEWLQTTLYIEREESYDREGKLNDHYARLQSRVNTLEAELDSFRNPPSSGKTVARSRKRRHDDERFPATATATTGATGAATTTGEESRVKRQRKGSDRAPKYAGASHHAAFAQGYNVPSQSNMSAGLAPYFDHAAAVPPYSAPAAFHPPRDAQGDAFAPAAFTGPTDPAAATAPMDVTTTATGVPDVPQQRGQRPPPWNKAMVVQYNRKSMDWQEPNKAGRPSNADQ